MHTSSTVSLPSRCLDRSTGLGLAYLARDASVYLLAIAVLLRVDQPLLLLPLWVLAALGISALFVLAHDAAHEALFRSSRLCAVVGRAAFLPSLHGYEPWVEGHNRIHHGHTGRRDVDFVWHPLTREQYASLPVWGKLAHRLEWTPWGAWLYYLRAVWWKKMMRAPVRRRWRAGARRDRALVLLFFALFSTALLRLGYERSGVAGAAWTWVKVFLVPWLLWNEIVGAVVYLHHISPDAKWSPRQSRRVADAALEGTLSYRLPGWLNFFWHNIFLHVPHHVAPCVPFYRLPLLNDALTRANRAGAVRSIGLSGYFAIARACKLYDFERRTWTRYDGAPAASREGRSRRAP